MVQKYQVIRVYNESLSSEILGTFATYAQSIEFLNVFIDSNYDLNDFLKVFHNDQQSVSIFEYYYLFPKKLLCKIHIIKYEDIDNDSKSKY